MRKVGRERRRGDLEDRIVELRAEGLLNVEIARTLGLSAAAVSNLVCRMRKEGRVVAATTYGPGAAREVSREVR
jgi:transposase